MLTKKEGKTVLTVGQMIFTFDREDTIKKLPLIIEEDISILSSKIKQIFDSNPDLCFFNHLYKQKTLCADQLALNAFNHISGEDIIFYVVPLEKHAEVDL